MSASAPFAEWDESTLDLALEEVTTGLARGRRDELLERVDSHELRLLERSVVALNLASLDTLEEPPAALSSRIDRDARAHFALVDAPRAERLDVPAPPGARTRVLSTAGWLAAAILLAFVWLRNAPERPSGSADRRDTLLATAGDLVRAPWVATGDPLAGSVSGDVVWSRERQEGYLRFVNLPRNDPQKSQYQLWIFDKSRVEWDVKPVDGGVFDVGPGAEVVVPIDAKLEIRQAALFAVTLERPGGVVVSAREHLLATATP